MFKTVTHMLWIFWYTHSTKATRWFWAESIPKYIRIPKNCGAGCIHVLLCDKSTNLVCFSFHMLWRQYFWMSAIFWMQIVCTVIFWGGGTENTGKLVPTWSASLRMSSPCPLPVFLNLRAGKWGSTSSALCSCWHDALLLCVGSTNVDWSHELK